MSHQNLADAFIPAERDFKNKVMSMTWGHLHPEYRKVYKGYILFTHGAYGDITPIKCEFKDLPDSPWFFQEMEDFLYSKCVESSHFYRGNFRTTKGKVKVGQIARFDGTYVKFKNDGYRFSGKVKIIKVS